MAPTKRTQERASFVSRLAYGVPVFIASWLLFNHTLPFPRLQSRIIPKNIYTEAAAITLTALGIAFAIWARFYIGQNWSSAVSALARREPRGWISVARLWLGFWFKLRMEEQFMHKTFGPEYEAYSQSTGALVPRLHI